MVGLLYSSLSIPFHISSELCVLLLVLAAISIVNGLIYAVLLFLILSIVIDTAGRVCALPWNNFP